MSYYDDFEMPCGCRMHCRCDKIGTCDSCGEEGKAVEHVGSGLFACKGGCGQDVAMAKLREENARLESEIALLKAELAWRRPKVAVG